MTAQYLRRVVLLGLVASCTALTSSCSLFRTPMQADPTSGMRVATPALLAPHSVSYTHLDVYKRQVLGSSSPSLVAAYCCLAKRTKAGPAQLSFKDRRKVKLGR